jgi:hypothetical protein
MQDALMPLAGSTLLLHRWQEDQQADADADE